MTKMEFFGCGLIAFGPPLSLFIWTVARCPLRVLVFITSAFFWLLSLLASSIIWFAVVPLRDYLVFGLVFSVIIQEAFRLLFYVLITKADDGLRKMVIQTTSAESLPLIDSKHLMAYVAGLGSGVMSGAFSMVNVLADMYGPGTIGIHGDSHNFFLASASTTLCFILLHTFWSIVAFDGMRNKRYLQVAAVTVSHMIVSGLTLFNQRGADMYYVSLLPAYAMLVVMACCAFKVAGGSVRRITGLLQGRRISFTVT